MLNEDFDAVFYPVGHGPLWDLYSNSEEAAVGLTEIVPYLVEDRLTALGGLYEKSDDWNPIVVIDGLLITGQNPASSSVVADVLIKTIS